MTKSNTSTIKTVSDFQEEVLKLTGSFAYRGESNKAWKVRSGAYRRLENNVNRNLIEYTENIVNQANNYKQEIKSSNDLEILAELQHLGAATPLIDFSTNALTALWFACEDTAKDGKVVCLKVGDKERFLEVSSENKNLKLKNILSLSIRENKTYTFGKWKPPLNNHRIVKQDSLFIFTLNGKIEGDDFEKMLIIDSGSKSAIRDELEQLCGMTQTSIYPDFYGFATSNSADKNYQEPTVEELTEQGNELYQQGKYIQAEPYYTAALKTAEQLPDKAVIAECQNNLGLIWHALGEYKKAIDYYELALASALNTYGEAHPKVATCCNNLGLAWNSLGEYKKAIGYFELALASDLKTYGEAHPKVAIRRNNLGLACHALGEYKKAIDYYELALASALNTYGETHPKVAIRRNNLGMTWLVLGKIKKAIEYFELALASDLKTYGEAHPDVAIDRNNLGGAWKSLGEYKKAIEYFELALASDLKTYGEAHPDVAIDRNNLGGAWHALGKYKKAIEYFELALASDLKTYGAEHPDVAIRRNNLGNAWDSLGEYKKAIDYYELALASDLKTYGEAHPQVATYHNNLGGAWNSLGEHEKAIEYYELALDIFKQTLGDEHPHTKQVAKNLAEAKKANDK